VRLFGLFRKSGLNSYKDKNSLFAMKSDLNHFNHRNVPLKYLQIPTDEDGVQDKYFAIINKEGNIENVFFSKT
jgi:hypothetical protein